MKPRELSDPESVHEWLQEIKGEIEKLAYGSTFTLSFIMSETVVPGMRLAIEEYIHNHLDRPDIEIIINKVGNNN